MRSIAMKLAVTALFFAAPSAPLFAQAAAAQVGMQVVDVKGALVGTVTAAAGDTLTVRTGKHDIPLPAASFTADKGKLLFGMSQAELDSAYEAAAAKAAASLVAGASVKGSGGATVGTIEAIDAEFVTIKLNSGKLIRLPRASIAGSAEGGVIGMTAAQLEAEVNAPGNAN